MCCSFDETSLSLRNKRNARRAEKILLDSPRTPNRIERLKEVHRLQEISPVRPANSFSTRPPMFHCVSVCSGGFGPCRSICYDLASPKEEEAKRRPTRSPTSDAARQVAEKRENSAIQGFGAAFHVLNLARDPLGGGNANRHGANHHGP